jgi:hypothetical protein
MNATVEIELRRREKGATTKNSKITPDVHRSEMGEYGGDAMVEWVELPSFASQDKHRIYVHSIASCCLLYPTGSELHARAARTVVTQH